MYPRFLTLQTGSGFACYKEIPCTITRPAEVCFALCLGYLTCTLAFPAGFLDLRVEGAGTLAIITGLCHPDFLGIVAVRACCVGMLIRHVSLRFCMTVQKKGPPDAGRTPGDPPGGRKCPSSLEGKPSVHNIHGT